MIHSVRATNILFAAMLLLAAGVVTRAEQAPESLDHFPRSTADVSSRDGPQRFTVWIADTPARSEQGLMFVRSLAHDQGMIFPNNHPGPMAMWMKNTLIPLDMLFVDADGGILYIKREATPRSEEVIRLPTPVMTPVAAVLELAGGECKRRHIDQGDHLVLHGIAH